MDIEKFAKFVETYVRDYIFSVFATLAAPWDKEASASASEMLKASAGRTWLFALLSITIGTLAYSAGQSKDFSAINPASVGLILTVWLWILTACLAHIVGRLFGGTGQFTDTLGVCIRVFAVAYVVASLIAMTVGLFTRVAFDDYAAIAAVVYLVIQFIILMIYIPDGMVRAHSLGRGSRVALGLLIPTIVAGVNVAGIFIIGSIMPMAAPPLMAPPMLPRPPMSGSLGGSTSIDNPSISETPNESLMLVGECLNHIAPPALDEFIDASQILNDPEAMAQFFPHYPVVTKRQCNAYKMLGLDSREIPTGPLMLVGQYIAQMPSTRFDSTGAPRVLNDPDAMAALFPRYPVATKRQCNIYKMLGRLKRGRPILF